MLASVDSASVRGRLPCPDGVSCARRLALGANTPWNRVRCARGGTGLQYNIIDRPPGTQAHIRVPSPDEVNRVLPAAAGVVQLVLEMPHAQRLHSINNWQQLRDALEALPDVTVVSPPVSGPALARRGEAVESVALVTRPVLLLAARIFNSVAWPR